MTTKRTAIALSAGLGIVFSAATALAQDDKDKITFMDHVMPVLEDACLNCHNPDEAKGGLDLTSYGATMSGGSGGEVVKAGDPAGSRLFSLMAHAEEPFMPPQKPKSDNGKLEIIKKWIEGGLLETKSSKAKKSTSPTLGGAVEVTTGKPENPAMPEHVLLEPEVTTTRANAITAIAASPWAPIVAIGGQKQVILYNTDNYELLGIFSFEEGFPETLEFSRNGSLLLAGGGRGGKSGKAVAWDVQTGERVLEVGREFDTALAADISPNHSLVTLGGPGRNIKIFDTATGEQLHSLKKHPDWLMELEYSPDGVLFSSGGRNGGLYVWEAASGIEFYELKEHQRAITGISWRADSNVMAASSEDGQVSIWEMQNGRQVRKWAAHGGGALAVDFNHDGSKLVTCGRDNRVKIWDLNGKLLKDIPGFPDVVTAVTFTHDGKRIVSGDWTGALKVWDAESGAELAQLVSNPPSIAEQKAHAVKRVDEITKQIPTLDAAVKKAGEGTAAGKTALATATKALADTKAKRAAADAVVKTADKKLADITAQINQAKAAVDAKKKAVQQNAEQQTKVLPAQLAQHKKDLQNWEAQFKARNDALVKAKADVEKLKGELAQLPDNPDLKAKLDAAQKLVASSPAAIQEADTKRRQAGTNIQQTEQKIVQAKQAAPKLATEVKAAELVFTERNKMIADAKKAADAAKAQVAALDKVIPGQEAAVKAATDKVNQLAAAENKAQQDAKQARFDLDFSKFQVDKWAAAEVNVVLHENKETLQNFREKLIDVDGQAKGAVTDHQKATQARVQAEKTLADAKKTIADGEQFLKNATQQVLEARLKMIAARTLSEMKDGKAVEAAAKPPAPEFENVIKATYKKAEETMKTIAAATETAKKTPALIAERTKIEAEKKAAVERAVQAKQRQEAEIKQQSQRVDALEKKYQDMYREWDPNAEGKEVASSK